jgi:hypothetical protein
MPGEGDFVGFAGFVGDFLHGIPLIFLVRFRRPARQTNMKVSCQKSLPCRIWQGWLGRIKSAVFLAAARSVRCLWSQSTIWHETFISHAPLPFAWGQAGRWHLKK